MSPNPAQCCPGQSKLDNSNYKLLTNFRSVAVCYKLIMDLVTEGGKEVIFGGLAGLAAGYVSKKLGSHLAGAVITSGFVVFRAAVYDGQYLATWSPLARDSTDFTQHLKRKARREAFSVGKRLEDFSQQNFLILGGYVGAYMMGSAR